MSTELQKVGRSPSPLFFWFAIIAILITGGTVQAQTAAGSVSGQISDPSGAVLPDTPVRLTNRRTGISLDTKTNGSGSYQFLSVPSGSYLLTVKHDGFVQIERNFDLAIQQAGRIDLQMALSGATQTVDVQETNIGLETETSSLGQVVSARDLVSLPVSGRNPLALARLAPGVTALPSFGLGIVDTRGAVQAAGNNDF